MTSASIALYMDVLLESGVSFKTRAATANDRLCDVIVTINGSQHRLFSAAANELRGQCFLIDPGVTLEDATYAYLLDSFHKRNWATVRSLLGQ